MITNGPTPALIVCATVFEAGSTIAIEFLRICGTHTWPPTTSGSPSAGAPASGTVVTTAFDFGSMRVSPFSVVTQTASADAAVQPAPPWIGILASTLCEAGSTRITPSMPVAQTEPNAPTAPVAIWSFHRFTTRFFAGSIRSSSPCVNAVVQAEPNANVVSYGVNPTLIASRFPVVTETRLTVDVFVSSIHIEPAPKPRPHEPVPILVRETTLFVLGSILRRYG